VLVEMHGGDNSCSDKNKTERDGFVVNWSYSCLVEKVERYGEDEAQPGGCFCSHIWICQEA
jgi:hypothetical protein